MNAVPNIARPEPSGDQVVTSSDLVRHFGVWQDRAARSPVYVLQRGRPRFVLTTVDVMEALCATHAGSSGNGVQDQSLIDAVADLLVVADGALVITRANRAARAYLGDAAAPGASVSQLTASEADTILLEAARRVAASGLGETLDLPSPTYAGRTLAMTIAPHGGGVAITAHDATLQTDLANARARDAAQGEALAAMQDMAAARINLRGYLEDPEPPLATLTGLSPGALRSVRFVSLLDIASRPAVGDAIDAVITDGRPRAATAMLLVNRGEALPVRIGMAALRQNGVVCGLTAMLARTAR
jgi:hypothetical protein